MRWLLSLLRRLPQNWGLERFYSDRKRAIDPPPRHGPACPGERARERGHLFQHVPRQVARTRRAMTMRVGRGHDSSRRKTALRRGRRLRVGIVCRVGFLSGFGTERASGTVHGTGRSCHIGNYPGVDSCTKNPCAPKTLVSREDAQHATQILSLRGRVAHAQGRLPVGNRIQRPAAQWTSPDYRSGLAGWNRTRLVVSYDLPRLGENL